MRKLVYQLTRRGAQEQEDGPAASHPEEPTGPGEAEPRLPPELPLFFMLSHLEDDGPVRLDGTKLGVCEVMGLEIDEPKLGAFAGALNALDFSAQLLIRQHPPRLSGLREKLREAQPSDLPPQTGGASRVAPTPAHRSRGPRRDPRPALLRRLRVRADRRSGRDARPGRTVGASAEGQTAEDVSRVRCSGWNAG